MQKLLIIEDDVIVANIYSNKFRIEGFEVETASDGEAGLKRAESWKPNVVILDLMLPKINGVELIKAFRARPEWKNLPLIVFSNSYLTSLVQAAWKEGATNCLIKSSCSPNQLVDAVKKALAQSEVASRPVSSISAPAANAMRASTGFSPSTDPNEHAFQVELQKSFVSELPASTAAIRTALQNFIKNQGTGVATGFLLDVYRRVHSFASNASLSGLRDVARMATALEALVKELHDKPAHVNASTIRTVAQTLDFLMRLVGYNTGGEMMSFTDVKILVVDDEIISRKAVVFALEKAELKSFNLEDPVAAYKMISSNPFDLIVLDVDMPEMNGFELCQKIRALPQHAKTPVIFVTGLSDFESRAKSAVSGGTDLIAKPFLVMELAVKALTHVYKSRLGI